MKNILLIFFLFLSYNVVAQQRFPPGAPTQFSTGYFKQGYHQSDSGTIIANRDTNWLAKYSATIVFKPSNKQFYWFDSTTLRWNQFGATLDTTSLSNRINLKQNILSNAGILGDSLLINNSIKRLQNDYGLTFSTNATKILMFIDTLGANHVVTTSQLKDTAAAIRSAIGGGGGITSVGLSMPSAFSVSGSPITTSGTFNVTMPGLSTQYVRANGTVATTDTGMIPDFYLKVRGLFSGASPITYSAGTFGILRANALGQLGAATFNNSHFSDNGAGLISLNSLVSAGSCTGCSLNIDVNGRITGYSTGAGGGINNINIGSGFRAVNAITQEMRTYFAGFGQRLDSVSNTDGLTWSSDTTRGSGLPSYFYTDSLFATSRNISNAALTANGDYGQNWNNKVWYVDSIASSFLFRMGGIGSGGTRRKEFRINWGGSSSGDNIDGYNILASIKKADNSADSLTLGIKSSGLGVLSVGAYNEASTNASTFTSYSTSLGLLNISARDSIWIKGAVPAASADSVLALRTTGSNGNGKLIKVPFTAGITLNNVGSGYRLAASPSGNIKTVFGNNTITIDSLSNTNALTFKTDTSVIATKYDLSQVAPKNLYGLIYAKGSWTSVASDFDNNGADTSLVSGKILLQPAGSPATFTQSIDLKGVTCLEYWRVLVQYTLKTTPSATTYGLGAGVRSINTYVTSSVLGYTDLTTDGTNGGHAFHAVDYPTPGVLATSTGSISRSLNDKFEKIVERNGNTLTVTERNLTTNSAAIFTTYDYSTLISSRLLPNTGKFSLFAIGGQLQIDSLSVFSKEMVGTDLLAAGDSKTVGYLASYENSYPAQTRSSFNGVALNAGPGDRPEHVFARLPEILNLRPKQVLLEIGTNAPNSDSVTTKGYIQAINDTLVAHGIRVIHTAFYQTATDAGWRYNYLLRTYPNVIDCYYPLMQPGTLDVDGIHPNDYGDSVISAAVLNSGEILYGKYYTPLFAGGSTGGSFINNSTSLQSSANFNIGGTGVANKFSVSPSNPSYATFSILNGSASSGDAPAIFRPEGANKSMEIYIVPNGSGSGGNQSAFTLFNSDYVADPANFGFVTAQMKATEFDIHTGSAGSGTTVDIKMFTGNNDQLVLKTDGTNMFTGNTFFNDKVVVGPSFSTPFAKSLIHAHRDINDAVCIMASNNNTGGSTSIGYKAAIDYTTDTSYIGIVALGANYSHVSRPGVVGSSSLVESTLGGDMYISNYTDTGNIRFTTTRNMSRRLEIYSNGDIAIHKIDSTTEIPNVVYRDPIDHKLKIAAAPSGGSGISTLNTLSASTQTFATGTSGGDFNIVSSSSTHTFNIPSASTSNRGVITASSQTIGGVKTFNDGLVATSGANPRVTINGNVSAVTGPSTSGEGLLIDFFTHTNTAASTTISSNQNFNFIASPTLTSPNAISYTGDVATIRFVGAPISAGSTTISHPWNILANDVNYFGGIAMSLNEQSVDATIPNASGVNIYTGTGGNTWTLPSLAIHPGKFIFIKNAGSGNLTVQRAGSDNIYETSSVTSITIAAGASRMFAAGNSFWYVCTFN